MNAGARRRLRLPETSGAMPATALLRGGGAGCGVRCRLTEWFEAADPAPVTQRPGFGLFTIGPEATPLAVGPRLAISRHSFEVTNHNRQRLRASGQRAVEQPVVDGYRLTNTRSCPKNYDRPRDDAGLKRGGQRGVPGFSHPSVAERRGGDDQPQTVESTGAPAGHVDAGADLHRPVRQ